MPDALHAKLAAVGLVSSRVPASLGAFMASYITGRTDIGGRSHLNLGIAAKHINAFFGDHRQLRSITPAEADGFAIWAKAKFAEATAARIIKRARQFFAAAIRARILTENAFSGVKPGSMTNADRKFHVVRDVIDKVIQACPDREWRVIVALSRYGGLRCPSEVLGLLWADVNWETARILVRSAKTVDRFVPIFPELLPYLRECFEAAEPGSTFVVARYRGAETNLRTTFMKIIERAGFKPWAKPFRNLRASREIELAAEYPMHLVCEWIGKSQAVAAKHYLTVREEDFEWASAAKSGAVRRFTGCIEEKAKERVAEKCNEFATVQPVKQEVSVRNNTDYPRQDSNLRPSV